jgi:8-oxo-dGTP diphosphatase
MLPQRTLINHYGKHDKNHKRSELPTKGSVFKFSLLLNIIFAFYLTYLSTFQEDLSIITGREMVWHGGHPKQQRAASCWCSGTEDQYCMCTPNIAIDLVILQGDNVWLVQRKDTNQLATMGGFVDAEETVEHAVERELMEEMGIQLKEPPILFGVYSDPRRDNRRRTVSVVFAVHLHENIHPRAGDDAKEVRKIPLDDIEKHLFFADHRTILLDYRRHARTEAPVVSTKGDFATDIDRSTCSHYRADMNI